MIEVPPDIVQVPVNHPRHLHNRFQVRIEGRDLGFRVRLPESLSRCGVGSDPAVNCLLAVLRSKDPGGKTGVCGRTLPLGIPGLAEKQ
jgi:hypothetical protein